MHLKVDETPRKFLQYLFVTLFQFTMYADFSGKVPEEREKEGERMQEKGKKV